MNISISNGALSTQIFLAIFALALVATIRKKKTANEFSHDLTQEIKGFAILAIIFSHIGYFLVSDHQFLFPLSIAAGVGVNLFLFLSGYGLTLSALAKPLSILEFYRHRLPKLYVPLWVTLFVFLGLDFFVLGRVYGFGTLSKMFLGFFPRADLALDINSPLWYFTLIIFYYLLFPLVFLRKYPWVSALILYGAGYFLILWNPAVLEPVMRLYRVHILAFPLGVLVGALLHTYTRSTYPERVKYIWQSVERLKFLKRVLYWVSVGFLLWLIGYTAYRSHVGDTPWLEEATSLLTSLGVIVLFLISKLESRLLTWFGVYSFEIYLLHWPVLSRFDFLYRFTPAWLATIAYLAFFLTTGLVLQRIIWSIIKR